MIGRAPSFRTLDRYQSKLSSIPSHSEVVFVSDANGANEKENVGQRIAMVEYPLFAELTKSQETLVINDITIDERLNDKEKKFLLKAGAHSAVVNPLVARSRVIGLITVEYRTAYNFNDRELAMYRTLCNQTTIAIENARQIQYSQTALASSVPFAVSTIRHRTEFVP